MSHTPDEAIAKEVADRLLDRIPEDAGIIPNYKEVCGVFDDTGDYYCTRKRGHAGLHFSVNGGKKLNRSPWRRRSVEKYARF